MRYPIGNPEDKHYLIMTEPEPKAFRVTCKCGWRSTDRKGYRGRERAMADANLHRRGS